MLKAEQANAPRGKNLRTRTTTLTFPPGCAAAASGRPTFATGTDSFARKDGLEAVDRSVAAEAEVDRAEEGLVIPVTAETPDDEAEECEPGPLAWPMLV